MAKDNVTLGRFQLDGIPPARRGVPQIEVTFDIDANGIVHVFAKDLGTGKEQSINITASANMSDSEIQQKVKEAEQYAKEDQEKKDLAEMRNRADSLIYETEQSLKDLENDITEDEKATVEKEIESLKKALEGDTLSEIRAGVDALSNAMQPLAQKIYEKKAQEQQAQEAPQGESQPQDADYEVVDEE
jgi:molecular chaperone DnaK